MRNPPRLPAKCAPASFPLSVLFTSKLFSPPTGTKLSVAARFTRSPNIPPEPSGSPEPAFEQAHYGSTTALLFGFDLGIDRRSARLERIRRADSARVT